MSFEQLSKQLNIINTITFNNLEQHLDSFSLAVIKDIIQLCDTTTSPSGKQLSTKIIINQGDVLLVLDEMSLDEMRLDEMSLDKMTTDFVAKNN